MKSFSYCIINSISIIYHMLIECCNTIPPDAHSYNVTEQPFEPVMHSQIRRYPRKSIIHCILIPVHEYLYVIDTKSEKLKYNRATF